MLFVRQLKFKARAMYAPGRGGFQKHGGFPMGDRHIGGWGIFKHLPSPFLHGLHSNSEDDSQEVMGALRFLVGRCLGTSSRHSKGLGAERAGEEMQGRKIYFLHLSSWLCHGSGLLIRSSNNTSV